jgi:hypothetical protein
MHIGTKQPALVVATIHQSLPNTLVEDSGGHRLAMATNRKYRFRGCLDAFGMVKPFSLIFCYETFAHSNFISWCLDAW